jgi:2-haloacid dehalogenase
VHVRRREAVICDLLSALLDSWTLWQRVAGGEEEGRRWRLAFLERAGTGDVYRPYLELAAEAARDAGLAPELAEELGRRWDELEPWPEVPRVLDDLRIPVAVVTNCSDELGRRAADTLTVELAAVVSAERAGYYKPHPQTYRLALDEVGIAPERVLYVAGAPYDVAGAADAGMTAIWHNRVGLVPDEDVPAEAVLETLDPLWKYL